MHTCSLCCTSQYSFIHQLRAKVKQDPPKSELKQYSNSCETLKPFGGPWLHWNKSIGISPRTWTFPFSFLRPLLSSLSQHVGFPFFPVILDFFYSHIFSSRSFLCIRPFSILFSIYANLLIIINRMANLFIKSYNFLLFDASPLLFPLTPPCIDLIILHRKW